MDTFTLIILGLASLPIAGFIFVYIGQKHGHKYKSYLGSTILLGVGGLVIGAISSFAVIYLLCANEPPSSFCGLEIFFWFPPLTILGTSIGVIIGIIRWKRGP
ncbi:hypothetical protein IH982_02900 [Patescibacteria group bacterium]|nr:hypothetical protein [Patescibacteria group bacterium]